MLLVWFYANTRLNNAGVVGGQRQLQAAAVPAKLFDHIGITHVVTGWWIQYGWKFSSVSNRDVVECGASM